jgi:mRNA interferase RelE/StbE
VAVNSVLIKNSAGKELEAVPRKDREKLIAKIRSLANNPRPEGSEKLAGDDRYRLRQGVYRILYEVDDTTIIVTVVRVAHRREVYR